jgi:GNAT superfamily N-acetyltransferase
MKTGAHDRGDEYPGITIRQPLERERTKYLEFYLRGFDAPVANFPAAIRNMRHLFTLPQLHFMMASRQGVDAGIGMLCVFGNTAVLAAGTTLPEHRKHGCHHALIAARIRLARDLGCTDIVSIAYAGGESHHNMEDMGLRTVQVTRARRFKGEIES